MTHQEILQAAIEKAIENGWDSIRGMKVQGIRKTPTHRYVKLTVNDDGMVGGEEFAHEEIIYNHDFAKALWGEINVGTGTDTTLGGMDYPDEAPAWQHHLQQMVISDDPIAYLGDNLNQDAV